MIHTPHRDVDYLYGLKSTIAIRATTLEARTLEARYSKPDTQSQILEATILETWPPSFPFWLARRDSNSHYSLGRVSIRNICFARSEGHRAERPKV